MKGKGIFESFFFFSSTLPSLLSSIASIISWVQLLSRVQLFVTPRAAAHQASLSIANSPTPRACSNSYPLSQLCHPAISYSVVPLSSPLQSSSFYNKISILREKNGMNLWLPGEKAWGELQNLGIWVHHLKGTAGISVTHLKSISYYDTRTLVGKTC